MWFIFVLHAVHGFLFSCHHKGQFFLCVCVCYLLHHPQISVCLLKLCLARCTRSCFAFNPLNCYLYLLLQSAARRQGGPKKLDSLSLRHIQVLTKDSVTVSVDAVVYYRVSNATVSVANVENAHHSTRLLAQTTLRNILGTKNLHEILSDRESISGSMQVLAWQELCDFFFGLGGSFN